MPHNEHCDCNHDNMKNSIAPTEVNDNQKDFIHQLSHHQYLPVARFTLTDSKEEDFLVTALAPVFIHAVDDDMDTVKQAGAFLQKLEDMGLITLDYDIALKGYDYKDYNNSAVYEYFCTTVAEGAANPDFLGDTPLLELGSMALTPAGEEIAASLCGDSQHIH